MLSCFFCNSRGKLKRRSLTIAWDPMEPQTPTINTYPNFKKLHNGVCKDFSSNHSLEPFPFSATL
jgi:hypothetical protein